MNLTEKKYAALAEMQTGENISRICGKYYHNLKDKEVISKLLFEERIGIAHEIIAEAKEREVYFYRRAIDEYSLPEEITTDVLYNSPINLASNDYLGFSSWHNRKKYRINKYAIIMQGVTEV